VDCVLFILFNFVIVALSFILLFFASWMVDLGFGILGNIRFIFMEKTVIKNEKSSLRELILAELILAYLGVNREN